MTPPHPTPTLFPYTTLFRSLGHFLLSLLVLLTFQLAQIQITPGHVDKFLALVFAQVAHQPFVDTDRKSTRLNSSHVRIPYAVFCLKKKTPSTGASPPRRRPL